MTKLFVLFLAASPTDQGLLEAEVMGMFPSDFECSEAEADVELANPEAHVFCTTLTEAIKLKGGNPLP